MEGLDRGKCPAAFLRVRDGLGFPERFLARADCFGEKRGSRFIIISRRHGPGATHMAIVVVRIVAGCWKFKVGRRKFTDGCAVRFLC
jgi:hypothetical protein